MKGITQSLFGSRARSALIIVAALVAGLFLFAGVSQAQQEEPSITLAISPQKLELSANPGDTLNQTLRLTNGSEFAVDVRTSFADFLANGEDGKVALTQESTPYSLSQWLSLDTEGIVTIPSRSSQDFDLTIDVPEDAEPGGHFGAAVFTAIPPETEGTGARTTPEVTTIMLLKVAGDVVESGQVLDFESNQSLWSNEDALTLTARIQNTGNVHFVPSGVVAIKNMFGSTVAEIQLPQQNVIPEATRRFEVSWQDRGFQLGRYTADLTVTYPNGDIQTASTSFTVFPYQIIVPLVVGFLVLLALLIRGRTRITAAAKAFKSGH